MILTHLLLTLPLAVWVLMWFFATLPRDLEKAARMDGCGRLQAFRRVVLPMARPGIVAAPLVGNILPAIAVGAVLQRYIRRLRIVDPNSVVV